MSETPTVSLIIPCFNEEKVIERSIDQGIRQDYAGKIEIIVVDDGSTDHTPEIVEAYTLPADTRDTRALIYIRKPNGGKPSALNKGLEIATGEYSLYTDGDTMLELSAVRLIVDKFMEDENNGVVAGLVHIENGDSIFVKLQEIEYIFDQIQFRVLQSDSGDVQIAPGCIFGIRTDLARRFPSTDRTVVEDFDQTVQVRKAGYRTVQEPRAVSYTIAPSTVGSWWNQRKRWWYGTYQIWNQNRDHLKGTKWFLYSYPLGSIMALLSIVLIFETAILITLIPNPLWSLQMLGSSLAMLLMLAWVRQFIFLHETRRLDLAPYIAPYLIYDFICRWLRAYLYLRYLLGMGVSFRYGPREFHVV